MKSDRATVRHTALKMLRTDELIGDEQSVAAALMQANPSFGYPHAVRCDWCRKSATLFRDENEPPFTLTPTGWKCEPCDSDARSQEIRFSNC